MLEDIFSYYVLSIKHLWVKFLYNNIFILLLKKNKVYLLLIFQYNNIASDAVRKFGMGGVWSVLMDSSRSECSGIKVSVGMKGTA